MDSRSRCSGGLRDLLRAAIIGGVTALTAGLSAWAGLSVAQIAGVALLVLALGFVGFFGLRRRKADCACETACSIETCEKP